MYSHLFPHYPYIFPMYSPIFRPTPPCVLQGTLHSCSFSEGISSTPEKETPPLGVLSQGLPLGSLETMGDFLLKQCYKWKWKNPPVNSSQLQSV